MIHPASYLEVISMFDATMPHGRHYYSKTRSLKQLDDQALEMLLASSLGLSPRHFLIGSPFKQVDHAEPALVLKAQGKTPAHLRLLKR